MNVGEKTGEMGSAKIIALFADNNTQSFGEPNTHGEGEMEISRSLRKSCRLIAIEFGSHERRGGREAHGVILVLSIQKSRGSHRRNRDSVLKRIRWGESGIAVLIL